MRENEAQRALAEFEKQNAMFLAGNEEEVDAATGEIKEA